jgi:outer membrane protein assembly factor BamB
VIGTALPAALQTPAPPGPPRPPAPTAAFETAWTIDLGSRAAHQVAIAGDVVIVSGSGLPISARALADGSERWSTPNPITGDLAIGDRLIFAAVGSAIEAYDQATGRRVWQQPIGEGAVRLVWRAGWLFAAIDRELRALRAADGREEWRTAFETPIAAGPSIDGDAWFAALDNRDLIRVDLQRRAVDWRVRLDVDPLALLAANGVVYLGAAQGGVHAFRQGDGSLDWSFRSLPPTVGPFAADAHHLYVITADNTLRALHASRGAEDWHADLPSRSRTGSLVAGNQVLVSVAGGDVIAYPAKTGRPVSRMPFPKLPDDPPGLTRRLEASAASQDANAIVRLTIEDLERRRLTLSRRTAK